MSVRGVSRIGEGDFLESEAKGGLFILGGEYVKQEEGCVSTLLPEPTGDSDIFELFVMCFPVVVHFLE